jgi:hypothetical protein
MLHGRGGNHDEHGSLESLEQRNGHGHMINLGHLKKKMTNNELADDSFQDSLPSGFTISSMAMGATMMGMENLNPMAMDLSYIISETIDK